MLPATPSLRLDARNALVTGAGRRIGVALASALAEAGARVWLVARSKADVDSLAVAIAGARGHAEALPLDVTVTAEVEAALADLPAFDILVNNAGTNRPKPMSQVSLDDYD